MSPTLKSTGVDHFGTKFEEEGTDFATTMTEDIDNAGCHYEPSAFCQIILVFVYEFGS